MTPAQLDAMQAQARIRVLINRSAGQHWMHIQRAFEKARAAA